MKKSLLLSFVALVFNALLFSQGFITNPYTLTRPPILGASPFQDSLWGVDTTGLGIIYRIGPSPSSGGSITGTNGLTMHPHTGELYVVVKQSAVTGRVLGKFNWLNGVVTIIGNLGDNFSTISFREDGQLFGVTGDGATVPETMYLIDHTNANKTVAAALGAGADGEVIAYNYDDNFFYHWSGNGTIVYEKVMSVAPYTATNIPIIGTTNGETFGAVYLGADRFRISNIGSAFNNCFTNGTWSAQFGSNPDDLRGLALVARWITGPTTQNTTICADDSVMLNALATTYDGNRNKFQWVLNGVNIPGANSSTYYANQTGDYNCRIILDSLNCNNQTMDSALTAYTDTAWFGRHVQVNPLPIVNINPSPLAYICNVGDSVLLTGTSGGTSQWYLNGSMIAGATTNTFYASALGSYNMTKTNLNGCVDTANVPAQVLMAPTPAMSSTGNECFGDSVLLTTNTGASSYNWLLSGTSTTTNTVEMLYVSTSGDYSVATTFGTCVDTSNNIVITFAPQFTVTPSGTGSICIGSSQLLTATAGGSSYQWLLNGSAIGGATSDTMSATTTGIYTCIITYPACTDTTVTQYSLTAVDCSGIEDNGAGVVSIYPNPATDKLNISIPNNGVILQIDIVDLSGRKVMSAKPNHSTLSINVEELRSGAYLISVKTEHGVKTTKFIKN